MPTMFGWPPLDPPMEIEAFEEKGVNEWKKFLEKYKSIKELSYPCPRAHCKKKSKVDKFTGHHLKQSVQNVSRPLNQMVLGYWRVFTCSHVNKYSWV